MRLERKYGVPEVERKYGLKPEEGMKYGHCKLYSEDGLDVKTEITKPMIVCGENEKVCTRWTIPSLV